MIKEIKNHSERMAKAIKNSKTIFRLSVQELKQKNNIADWEEIIGNNDYNCILCSSEIFGLIENLNCFKPLSLELNQSNVFKKNGILNERFFIYTDIYLPGKYALILDEKKLLNTELELNCNLVVLNGMEVYYDKIREVIDAPGF